MSASWYSCRAVSCAAATATIRIHGYCQRDFPSRTPPLALPAHPLCPSKHTGSQEITSKHTGSQEITPEALLRQALRYRSYWRGGGGITVSGGEPLLQADFLCEFFQLAKEQHIHTTLDTAGQPFTTAEPFFSRLTTLLEHTDLVILDLKHIDPEKHRLLTGHSNESILSFARFLDQIHKPMWVRHVLVPGITDAPANLHGIRAFLDTLSNVEKVEILPYHTLGIYKWETLGIPYSLSDIRIPDENDLKRANQILLG